MESLQMCELSQDNEGNRLVVPAHVPGRVQIHGICLVLQRTFYSYHLQAQSTQSQSPAAQLVLLHNEQQAGLTKHSNYTIICSAAMRHTLTGVAFCKGKKTVHTKHARAGVHQM